MKAREKEYKLYRESITLQTAYMNIGNYEKSKKLQNRQNEVYKKWKFYKLLRLEMEKEKNDKISRHSNSK